MADLKLLEELEKLNGLPLEKEGLKIKESLPISDEMKKKVGGITNPYIIIEGDRDKAIELAAYIYLSKGCSVYSDVYLRREDMGILDAAPFREAQNPEPDSPSPWVPGEMPKGTSRIYVELFHNKETLRKGQSAQSIKTFSPKQPQKIPLVRYRYLNENGFIEGDRSMEDVKHEKDGSICSIGTLYRNLKFVDHYKGIKWDLKTGNINNFWSLVAEHQTRHKCSKGEAIKAVARSHPDEHGKYIASLYDAQERKDSHRSEVKLKFIREVIYSNNFRYVDRENSIPKKLLELELMDRRGTTGMTMFDMLKYKSTVLLLDFMKYTEDEKRDKLPEFARKLYALKKGIPGFLIVHVDKIEKSTKKYLDQFDLIPLGNSQKKRKPNVTDKDLMYAFRKATKELGKDSKVDILLKLTYKILEIQYRKKPYSSWLGVKKRYYEIQKKTNQK